MGKALALLAGWCVALAFSTDSIAQDTEAVFARWNDRVVQVQLIDRAAAPLVERHEAEVAERKVMDVTHKAAREALGKLKQAAKSFKAIDSARAKGVRAAEKAAVAKPKRRRRRRTTA